LRFTHRQKPGSKLWVVFSPRTKPVVEKEVTINISPATQATQIDMLGNQTTVTADSSGNITLTSTSSPVYLKVGE